MAARSIAACFDLLDLDLPVADGSPAHGRERVGHLPRFWLVGCELDPLATREVRCLQSRDPQPATCGVRKRGRRLPGR
jgi:hypothetical protein